jgi:EAL domain-containing protein (putative c-di-GMP-specific phosphodiesterase class I)
VADTELRLLVSVGIALSPDDGDEFEILLKKADMAMYRAKSEGRDTYRFFNAEMSYEATEQLNIRVGLRKALELNQFQLFYQPQLDIKSGKLVGAEALIRWFHPEFGMVSPAHFIPVAEASGLIVAIGDWVLQEACREVARWRDAGMSNPVVAVNLSALQFARGNIEQTVSNAVADAGILPQMLELELTESIMIRNTERVLATVKRLKQKGFVFTIDDFGTGYSSLQYLKRFEVDKLKIDQSFVRDIIDDEDDAAIVRAIVQIAKGLGLKTIAEGVETAEIMGLLQQYQCDEVQGYYLARPMSASQFMTYLQQHC